MATKSKPLDREQILSVVGQEALVATVLGRSYKDTLTGMSGIAVSRTNFLHSCVRVGIQLPAKLGPKDTNEYPDTLFLDEKQLVPVESKTVIPYTESPDTCKLGDTYEDTITGFTGVAVSVTKFLYAAERTALQPTKLSKEGKPIDSQVFDSDQLKNTKAKSMAPPPKPAGTPVGGPGRIATSHSVPKR